jgi:REP element-mobilizing transposase RayT
MRGRNHEAPLPDPLGYFITWSTYGTWLPGDDRGWVEYRRGWQFPNPILELESGARMTEDACRLTKEQRQIVEEQVAETCRYRGWTLHAVNCRSNHVHVVLTAARHPDEVRTQLKAWCTRRLKEFERKCRTELDDSGIRENWWAERGSQRYINDEESLEAAILYVRDGQDKRRE